MREPLNLPRGSVRAILTLALLTVSAAALFVPIAEGAGEVRGMFVALTGLAVKDYFEYRKRREADEGPPVDEPDYRDDR